MLMTESRKTGRGRNTPNLSSTGGTISCSSVPLNIPVEEKTWLSNTWEGRPKNLAMFNRVEDDFVWYGGKDITPKYIGDGMILPLGLTEDRAKQMITVANEQALSVFYSQEK